MIKNDASTRGIAHLLLTAAFKPGFIKFITIGVIPTDSLHGARTLEKTHVEILQTRPGS